MRLDSTSCGHRPPQTHRPHQIKKEHRDDLICQAQNALARSDSSSDDTHQRCFPGQETLRILDWTWPESFLPFTTEPDLWDHPDPWSGVWSGLSAGSTGPEDQTAPEPALFRSHWNQVQPASAQTSGQRPEVRGELDWRLSFKRTFIGLITCSYFSDDFLHRSHSFSVSLQLFDRCDQ